MKFASFEINGRAAYGLVRADGIVDLTARLPDYPSLKSLIAAGLERASPFATAPADYKETDIAYLPPVPDPAHFWCLALNYVEHHDEVQSAGRVQELPKQPALFARFPDSLAGHRRPMLHPGVSEQFDYEGELGVIIGKGGRSIPESEAMAHIAGYTIVNEGSVRDWQFHTRQITPGKNFYQSGAAGPWLATPDEIDDVYKLRIQTRLNGETLQDGCTVDMVHNIARFIAYASTISPLRPGDLLATGTPSGVGFSRKPPVWMKPGDVCEISITGLGTLANEVAAS